MQPHLILIRHSAVQIDPTVPANEWSLSADGRSRCQTLAKKLQQYQPTRFITSHEAKARETGQIMADYLGVSFTSDDGLQEHDRQSVPYFANKVDFETAVANFFAHPNELVFGRETAVQATSRFTQAVNQQLAAQPRGNVAIVTHGTVLTLFICQYNLTLNPVQFWQSLTLPCAFVLTLPSRQLAHSLFVDS